jgi:hypothetical protein
MIGDTEPTKRESGRRTGRTGGSAAHTGSREFKTQFEAFQNELRTRFDHNDHQFDKIDERFAKIDERFVELDSRIQEGFGEIKISQARTEERFHNVKETVTANRTELTKHGKQLAGLWVSAGVIIAMLGKLFLDSIGAFGG